MKFEKLADSLVSLLNGNNYQYRMYKGSDGKRTSNPYEARYFYVNSPNMMFIIDEAENTLTVHKSSISFDVFRPLHKTLRNLAKRYFVNLEMKDYNNSFSPKDFSPTLLRKNYKINNIKNESYSSSTKTTERYMKDEKVVDISESRDSMVLSMNGVDGFTLPYEVEELVPYIVEHSLVHGSIDTTFIRNLYKTYAKCQTLREQSTLRSLTKSETKYLNETSKYFSV